MRSKRTVSQAKELCGLLAALVLASMAFAWLALAAVPGAALAQSPASPNGTAANSDGRVGAIEKLVQVHHDFGQFEGIILVAEGDQILFHRAYGLANRE